MAKSVLDIVIRTVKEGGADKETVAGLVNLKKGLMEAGAVAATFVAAYYAVDQVLTATVGAFVDYAAQVRETSRLTGTNAEDTSRMIQMADDAAISYESLQKALWFAAKNGLDVNVESMAALADKYVSLGSASEKAEFLAKQFGKSGAEMGKLLEKGGDGVRAANSAIDANLILTDSSVQKAREYEIAVDNLSDSWSGFKIAIGGVLVGPITTQLNKVNAEIAEQGGLLPMLAQNWRYLLGPIGAAWQAIDLFSNKTKDASTSAAVLDATMLNSEEGFSNYANAVSSIDYGSLLDTTLSLQDGFQGFADKAQVIQDKIAALDPTSADYAETLNGLEGELKQNAASQDAWAKKLVFSMVQARLAVGGVDAGEFSFLIQLGEHMGLVDSQTATMAQNLNASLDSIDLSKPREFESVIKDIMKLPDKKTFTVVANGVFTGFPDGFWNGFICFTGQTQILLPNGNHRAIEEIRIGDLVTSYDTEQKEFTVARVVQTFKHNAAGYISINGIQTTMEHPFWVNGEWKKAGEIVIGDVLLREDESPMTVTEITLNVKFNTPVYNIETDQATHNYFAGGVLVHNKTKKAVSGDLSGSQPVSMGMAGGSSVSTSSSVTNSGTTINVFNPTFNVASGKQVVDVLQALT